MAARNALIATTVIMYLFSTASIIEGLFYYTVQLPTLGIDPPDIDGILISIQISSNCLARVNVSLPKTHYTRTCS